MAFLILPQRWRQQPQGAVQIDWGHPISRGLVFAIVPTTVASLDLIGQNKVAATTVTGGTGVSAGPGGVGVDSVNTSTGGWGVAYQPGIFRTIGTEFTISVSADIRSTTTNSKLVCVPFYSNVWDPPYQSLSLGRAGSTDQLGLSYGATSGGTASSAVFPEGSFGLGMNQRFIASRSGANASALFNGTRFEPISNGLNTAAVGWGSGGRVSLMNRNSGSTGEGLDGRLYHAFIWNRALSEAEQVALDENPYQILRPVPARLYYEPAAAALPSATYYVKNGGSDSADGLSDANAWASLSKVNNTTLSPGDTVLFQRGSVWRESLLKYDSGASGNPITYGAYGTGTQPQIRGDDVVTGWTAETPESGVTGEDFTDTTGSKPLAWWLFGETSGNRASSADASNALAPSASPPTRGTGPNGDFSAEFVKANSQQFNLTEAGMSASFPGKNGVANGSMTIGGWIRIDAETGSDGGIFSKDTNFSLIIEGSVVCFRCFASGNGANAQSVDTGTYAAGSWRHYVGRITYNAGAAVGLKHEITLFVNGEKKTSGFLENRNTWTTDFVVGNATFKSNFDGAVSELFAFNEALTDAQIASIHAKGLDGARAASGPTLYYKAFASKAGGVFSNDAPLRMVTLKGDMQPGNEWWDAANLRQYVRLPGDADPATTTMEVGTRIYPVRIQGNNWWVFEDIWVRGAYKANFFADTNNNAIVRRCTLSHASENGIHVYTHTDLSTSGFEISDCVAYRNGACGITVAGNFATSMAGIRIQRNETYENCWQPFAKDTGVFAYTGGIRPIGREINDCIVEDNHVHDEGMDGDLSHGEGIWLDTVGLNCIVRRNLIERTTSWGVQIEDCDAVDVHSNVVVGTLYYPGIAIIRNCDDNRVFNNTLIDCQGGFNTDNTNGSHFAGNQFFNNIVSAASGWDIVANNGTAGAAASTFDRNIFSPNRADFLKMDANQYSTLSAWETAWGGGSSNTIQTPPTFVNAGAGNYRLSSGSSGIAAGAAIPAGTLDYDALAFDTATPTIGAFEFDASASHQVSGTVAANKPAITATLTQEFPTRAVTATISANKPALTAAATQTFPARSLTATLPAKKPALSATASLDASARFLATTITASKPALSATATQTAIQTRTVIAALVAAKPTIAATSASPSPHNVSAALPAPRPGIKATIGAVRLAVHSRAPSWRTVNAGTGAVEASWAAPLDPNALLDFTADWNMEMADDAISAAFVQLSAQAAAAGVVVHAESHDTDSITLWLKVDPSFQGGTAWGGPGENHKLRCRVATQRGRIHDRTFGLTVRHT